MKVQAFIAVETRDKYGQLKSYSKKEANSLVRGFIDLLQAHMSQAAIVGGWTDTGGTGRDTSPQVVNFAANSGAGVVTFGIVVGTGVAAVAVTDNALGVNNNTLIANGIGAGNLQYGACSVGNPATVGSARQFTVARTLTNGSGGDVNVTEVGLYVKINSWFACMDRTLNSFTVTNGNSSTVTYTIKVTV